MTDMNDLRVRIFADGADLNDIKRLAENPLIAGFTTNPTLMRSAGVTDYVAFAREVLKVVGDRPVSFEVFSDEWEEMEAQAREISTWGTNINVKIPVTNTRGEFSGDIIGRLSANGVPVNVTAMMTTDQVRAVLEHLKPDAKGFLSLFAGRIADTGRDPVPIIREAVALVRPFPGIGIIWASPRELLNVFQAEEAGCHVITVAADILRKLPLVGKDLAAYSLETVAMFRNDATKAGYDIPTGSLAKRES
ncbi:MAG TPA: transaldolase [Gemmatimonadaceae bacterium]|nr:transaldolase [Gemmatimonadaceae bacterium]